MSTWIFAIILVGLVAVTGFEALARRSYLRIRKRVSLSEIHKTISGEVSRDVFEDVWLTVGSAYAIDPRVIAPTDSFAELGKFDSWKLGAGEDRIEDWIDSKNVGHPVSLATVADLARWMQEAIDGQRVSES